MSRSFGLLTIGDRTVRTRASQTCRSLTVQHLLLVLIPTLSKNGRQGWLGQGLLKLSLNYQYQTFHSKQNFGTTWHTLADFGWSCWPYCWPRAHPNQIRKRKSFVLGSFAQCCSFRSIYRLVRDQIHRAFVKLNRSLLLAPRQMNLKLCFML